jgi:GNAT superfamily N-acetyltransferase
MTDEAKTIPVQVRVGTLDDLDAMMALAADAAEDNGFVAPDPMKILQDIYPALCREKGIVGIIGQPGEPIEAAILLRVGKVWYSEDDCLEEKAMFVAPAYRSAKGGRARKLCEFAKTARLALGLPLAIGVLSNNRTKGKVELYKRVFGEPAGVYFLIGAKTGFLQEAAE